MYGHASPCVLCVAVAATAAAIVVVRALVRLKVQMKGEKRFAGGRADFAWLLRIFIANSGDYCFFSLSPRARARAGDAFCGLLRGISRKLRDFTRYIGRILLDFTRYWYNIARFHAILVEYCSILRVIGNNVARFCAFLVRMLLDFAG